MAPAHVSDNWNFLPASYLRPRVTRDSVESSNTSGESSKYSIRSGSYPAEYSSHNSQNVRAPPPVPPLRSAGPVPKLPPRRVITTAPSMASATQPPEAPASTYSSYHRVKGKGFLFQRRTLAVSSILALCVSISMALLIGYKCHAHFQTKMFGADRTNSDNHTCIKSPEKSRSDASVEERAAEDNPSFQQHTYYVTKPMAKQKFRQVQFESQEINKCLRKCEHQQLNISHADKPNNSNIGIKDGTGLVISDTGWYFVYSSLFYRITKNPEATHESWRHLIRSIRFRFKNNCSDILSQASYNCNGICVNTNRSSYTAGVFYLCSGDVVVVEACGAMHVYGHEESSYLGLFMTSKFPEQSC